MHPIVAAGLLCGVMDMTAASIVYPLMINGLTVARLWKGVAQGLFGPAAQQGGAGMVIAGLLCHYAVAFGAATAFYLLTRFFKVLLRYPAAFGVLYGVWVFFFMQLVVVPLSRQPHRPFAWSKFTAVGIAIHIVCVGLPIALMTAYFSAPRAAET